MKDTRRKNHTYKTVILTDPYGVFVEVASIIIKTRLITGMRTDRTMKLILVQLVLLT